MKLLHLVGARPNFMKVAPLLEALRSHPHVESSLVHSGQHYDHEMSGSFLEDLGLPIPDVELGVGSASHAVQTARVMEALEPVRVIPPLPYLDMLGLMAGARIVLTDSGGVQEETTALGVPCLTLRRTTERPITLTEGTNTLVPEASREHILAAVPAALEKKGRIPHLWDGCTAERIARILARSGDAA